MPRRVFDPPPQGQLAPTAADLGEEAYRANLDAQKPEHHGTTAGTNPEWLAPEARNAPPGQHREDAQEVKLGQDFKRQRGVPRGPHKGQPH